MKISAIILAAGSGTRMNTAQNKQLIDIAGETVIGRTVRAFEKSESVNGITVVCKESELECFRETLGSDFVKLSSLVPGGNTRFESAKIGFSALSSDTDFVVIHDGARCLVTPEIIERVVDAAVKYGAATAATAVTDTLKTADGDGAILNTVSRKSLYAAQTPQVFSYSLYKQALEELPRDHQDITDDNMLMELTGKKVYIVDTDKENIKITTPFDVDFAEFVIKKRGGK